MINKELLEILACPLCKGRIYQEKEKIICKNCRKAYPIRENIPIMLVEGAEDYEEKKSA